MEGKTDFNKALEIVRYMTGVCMEPLHDKENVVQEQMFLNNYNNSLNQQNSEVIR